MCRSTELPYRNVMQINGKGLHSNIVINQAKENSCRHTELPNQNLRQIGKKESWVMIGHSNKQTDKDYYFLFVIYFVNGIKNVHVPIQIYVRMLKIILEKGI